jgi:O-antigen ligase
MLMPLLIAAAATTRSRIVRLLDVWTIGCVINAAVGVLDIAGFHLAPHAIAGSRSSGLTIHPNYLALTALMGTPPAMIWIGRSRRWTWAGAISVLLLIGGVYASGSRDGIVTVVFLIVVMAVAVPRFRRRLLPALPILLVGLGGAVALILMFTKAGNQILSHVRLGGNDVSAAGSDLQRTTAAHVAWVQIKARPLEGVGFSVIEDAQDIYLQVLAAGGLIAGVAFVSFVLGLFATARRAWRIAPRDEVVAATVCIVGWLVNGIFDSQLADKYLYVIPGLLIAMASVKDVPAPADNPDTGVAHQAEPSAGPASPPAPVPALRATTT